ncbi:Hint domain-containing protein [Palleronia abyssalis]|uniref:Hedgehog/Intein (Hint) domain-containing protein n=1 Tax=Palleronia abyssalis TaxID=1501240 RepID=A0A2R8BQC1_9RHOB|nr:Hint domain-containing protein [Palleronia abyssalis]SPJ22357.1 hypothetical protein PAA8504_00149 [Palleronia abyssalis]
MTQTRPAAHKTTVQTGLTAGVRIMTLEGPVGIEDLQTGDRIVTRQGLRVLRAVRVQEREAAKLVTINASVLGHDRPEAPITVAADQPILLRDWRAKALYGQKTAMVAAHRLVDGDYITATTVSDLRTFVLVFDTPQIIYAEGTEFPMGTTADEAA